MFTTGRLIFVFAFLLAFIGGMAWAYRKDIKISRAYYRGTLWVLVALFVIFGLLFLIVKLRN